ncbi:MAG: molybdopterin-dependent oxidoreductase [Desulfomonile sp.]|nr:molybdopterin-dependent oxidoreductase [Desulfomonile sp.]
MALLTIDDTEVSTTEGSTILEAATQAGIWIPTLCYYPKISPSDSCRMCIVEIDGYDRPMTSCNTVAVDGMRVRTDTPELRVMREEVMKLILADHPLECPTCPAGGECDIQNLTYRLGIYGTDVPLQPRASIPTPNWSLIEYNQSLCITCLRCVKVCHEVIGASALILRGVGYDARIDTRDGGPLWCDFCGECVEACPSGAMSNKVFRRWARSWELRKVSTVCPLCSAGCRMELNVKDGQVFRVTTDMDTHNKGTLCVGGRFGFDFIHSEDRLLTPLIRSNGELKPVSWEEATHFAADRLKNIISKSGPESVAGLASARLTNEDCYAFQKFFRSVVGANNVDSEARFSFLRVQRALELTCGIKGATNTLGELLQTGAILVVGIDPLEETPALGWKIKTAARRYDSNVIVANSRGTSLDQFARLRLRIRPYSESELALGMMKVILDQELWDTKFVRGQTTHFLPMKGLLDKVPMRAILRRTGVSEEDLVSAARIIGEAQNAAIIFGGDVILQETGLQCAMNLANLALLTGNMGRPNAGIYPIFEKGNIVGLCDMGVMPEYLPGYQNAAEARNLFESVWRTGLPFTRGLTVPEMVVGLENGRVRALYMAGADPLTDYPNAGRFASAIGRAEFVIAQDIFLSPTAQKAHVVFPAASFAEKEGTLTNIEHRIQKLNPALQPPGEARPDWSILEEVARAMGKPMGYFTAADVFREMTLTIPFYRGLRRRDLEGDGRLAHPFTDTGDRLRGGKPYAFAPVRTSESPTDPDSTEYPFEMIVGREMFHFGSTSTRSANLRLLTPRGELEISPEDADFLGLADGDEVTVSSRGGSFSAPVKVSATIPKGIVFAPTNFPDMGAYRLLQENTTVCNVKLVRRT